MFFRIPDSLRSEHEALHTTLLRAGREPGDLGRAASDLARRLHPHMLREEGLVFPNLGLLRQLGAGVINPEMADAARNAARIEQELPHLVAEHKDIGEALQRMLDAARAADATDYAEFAWRLLEHLRMEEEVLYPAAIVVGQYVRARLGG